MLQEDQSGTENPTQGEVWRRFAARAHHTSQPCCTVDRIFTHFSFWRRAWEYLIFLVCIASFVDVSYVCIFAADSKYRYCYVMFLDLFFIADYYVRTHTAYLTRGVLVTTRRQIKQRIGRFWLVVHIVASVPTSWALTLLPDHSSRWVWVLLVLSPKLLRLQRGLDAILTISRSLVYTSLLQRLFPLISLLLVVLHSMACIFYEAAVLERRLGNQQREWRTALRWADLPRWKQYWVSVYFVTTTVMTIGFGDLTPVTPTERFVVIFIQLIGVMLNSYIIGVMVGVLSDPQTAQFMNEYDSMFQYLDFKKVSEDLRREILHVFQTNYNRNRGAEDPGAVMRLLPETIRDHLKLDITRTCFMKISLMQLASERLLVSFANELRPTVFCPGEIIVRQDELCPVLHLFRSGIIQLLAQDQPFGVNNCDTGIGIGELELLVDFPRGNTVRAVTYVEGWTLRRADLLEALRPLPKLRRELVTIASLCFPGYVESVQRLLLWDRPTATS